MKKLALAVCLSMGLTFVMPAGAYVSNVVAAEEAEVVVDDSSAPAETADASVTAEDAASDEEKINGFAVSDYESASESLVNTLVTQEEMITQSLQQSPNDAIQTLVDAWDAMKDEVGKFKGMGDTTVTEKSGTISVVSTVIFEKSSAELVVNYNSADMSYDSISFDKIQTMAEKMSDAGMNTIMGLGTVFIMLVVMSLLISCFKFVSVLDPSMKKKKEPANVPAPAAPAAEPVAVEEEEDDLELVAVISAAIAAYEGTSADGFVVRSIKKRKR